MHMTDDPSQQLINMANASGFLLELAIERVISDAKSGLAWEVVREHHWSHPSLQQDGFIDLVATYGQMRLVIECKRPRDGVWLFLVPKGHERESTRVRAIWTESGPARDSLTGVDDVLLYPPSYETDNCIIRGQGEDAKPLLERLAGQLLAATESLANEDILLGYNKQCNDQFYYFPMIVTAASLQVAVVDVADISLESGTIEKATFSRVPFIRFYKSLSTASPDKTRVSDLDAAHKENQRTILVVNAAELPSLLEDWKVTNRPHDPLPPWEKARRR